MIICLFDNEINRRAAEALESQYGPVYFYSDSLELPKDDKHLIFLNLDINKTQETISAMDLACFFNDQNLNSIEEICFLIPDVGKNKRISEYMDSFIRALDYNENSITCYCAFNLNNPVLWYLPPDSSEDGHWLVYGMKPGPFEEMGEQENIKALTANAAEKKKLLYQPENPSQLIEYVKNGIRQVSNKPKLQFI